jgi:hypothetical protein
MRLLGSYLLIPLSSRKEVERDVYHMVYVINAFARNLAFAGMEAIRKEEERKNDVMKKKEKRYPQNKHHRLKRQDFR